MAAMTTAEVWDSAREAAAEKYATQRGLDESALKSAGLWDDVRAEASAGWSIQDMNSLRQFAAQVRESSMDLWTSLQVYQDTGLDQAITGTMKAEALWGRELAEQWESPSTSIRVLTQIANPDYAAGIPGAPQFDFQWRTIKKAYLPGSVAGLDGMINTATAAWGHDYEEDIVGYVDIQVIGE